MATSSSPSSSYYDVSDDEETGYSTVSRASTGRGVRLLFSKSKVYVHPTSSAKDNIPGYIALIQRRNTRKPENTDPSSAQSQPQSQAKDQSTYLLAWVPEASLGDARDTYVKVDMIDSESPPVQSYIVPPLPTGYSHASAIGLYAFAIPLTDIFSLLVRPPSLGWWYGSLVINTRLGETFPALFFHDSECESTILQKKKRTKESFDPFSDDGTLFWGGDEVLRWLRRYANVQRSAVDSSVYLLNPTEEDLVAFCRRSSTGKLERGLRASEDNNTAKDAGMDPFTKLLKETRWKVLEQLSKITTFTRRTAHDLADNPSVPPQVRRLLKNPEIQTLQNEFDSARLYLARWAMGIAEQSERERNQRIWTAKDLLQREKSSVGDFEILDMESLTSQISRKPVTYKEWNSWFDTTGRLLITVNEVKERLFHGGLDPEDGVRKEAWLFLLGVFPWDSSRDERKVIDSSIRDEYVRLKGVWWERLAGETSTREEIEWFRDERHRIEKDVHRTDRTIPLFAGEDIPHPDPDSPFADQGTNVHMEQMKDILLTYNEYNRELGYVQGMSDLLAPIYAVTQDGSIAFWAFADFMKRMERNFLRDQSGMRSQLLTLNQLVQLLDPELYIHLEAVDSANFFFFFRPLLVWFKREFEWPDVLRLWETLWTDYLSSSFNIFIAMAILEKHRDIILNHLKAFDEVLKYFNDLSGSIDLISTLTRAETLFYRFQKIVETVDRRNKKELAFPDPPSPVRHRRPGPGVGTSRARAQTATSTSSSASSTAVTNTDIITPELRALLGKEPITVDKSNNDENNNSNENNQSNNETTTST